MNHASKVSIEVIEGQGVIETAFESARRLWNRLRYINRQHKEAGDKYYGRFGMDKELRASADKFGWLSERCAGYILQEFDIAMRGFFKKNKAGDKEAHPPHYAEDGHTLTFDMRIARPLCEWTYRLTVLSSEHEKRHAVIRIHLQPGIKMAQVKQIKIQPQVRRGHYIGSIVLELPDVESHVLSDGLRCAGLDLGIINIGTMAFDNGETILYNGRALLDILRFGEKRAAKCKPSGWQPGKNRLPASERNRTYRNKAANILKLAVHNFTTSVIRECAARGITVLVVGDLTGIREDKDGKAKDFGNAMNLKLHRWPHLEIRTQLKYKGEEHGIEVVEVSERNTSRTCSGCGVVDKTNRVERGLYCCKKCGLTLNADVNGAINILRKVSPEPQGFGVGGGFPAPPSPSLGADHCTRQTVSDENRQTGAFPQTHPVFVADFGLRDWHVVVRRNNAPETRCNALRRATTEINLLQGHKSPVAVPA